MIDTGGPDCTFIANVALLSKLKVTRIPTDLQKFGITGISIGVIISNRKNKCLLINVDNLIKCVRLEHVRSVETEISMRILKKIINDVRAPEKLISDREITFTSKIFEEFCKDHEIWHTVNSPWHP